jgi:hypothetical protein
MEVASSRIYLLQKVYRKAKSPPKNLESRNLTNLPLLGSAAPTPPKGPDALAFRPTIPSEDVFMMFLTADLLPTIAKHTNECAAEKRADSKGEESGEMLYSTMSMFCWVLSFPWRVILSQRFLGQA